MIQIVCHLSWPHVMWPFVGTISAPCISIGVVAVELGKNLSQTIDGYLNAICKLKLQELKTSTLMVNIHDMLGGKTSFPMFPSKHWSTNIQSCFICMLVIFYLQINSGTRFLPPSFGVFSSGLRPRPQQLEVLVASSNMLGIREGYVHKVIPRSQCAGGSVGKCWCLGRAVSFCFWFTLPKFNMEAEIDGFQKEYPFPDVHFQVACEFFVEYVFFFHLLFSWWLGILGSNPQAKKKNLFNINGWIIKVYSCYIA